jgi:putative transposase
VACRELYHAVLQKRKVAWEHGGTSVTFGRQSVQLPGRKEVRSEYQDSNARVLQDIVHRLDKAYQAHFQSVSAGDAPGYPRFQGRHRYQSCP